MRLALSDSERGFEPPWKVFSDLPRGFLRPGKESCYYTQGTYKAVLLLALWPVLYILPLIWKSVKNYWKTNVGYVIVKTAFPLAAAARETEKIFNNQRGDSFWQGKSIQCCNALSRRNLRETR